jgi:hypothetical protein
VCHSCRAEPQTAYSYSDVTGVTTGEDGPVLSSSFSSFVLDLVPGLKTAENEDDDEDDLKAQPSTQLLFLNPVCVAPKPFHQLREHRDDAYQHSFAFGNATSRCHAFADLQSGSRGGDAADALVALLADGRHPPPPAASDAAAH